MLWGQNANAAVSLTYVGDFNNNNHLVDGDRGAKWEGGAGNDMWCIFKTSVPIKATSYVLTTGNDNNPYVGRNWKNWTVFGGNFADDNAAKSAARSTEGGWVALDIRENDEILQDVNTTDFDFTMTNPDSENFYTYYLVKVTANKGANWMQMGEFAFKDYTVDTSAYDGVITSAKSFDTSNADTALQDEYAALVGTLDDLKAAGASTGDFDELDAALDDVNVLQRYINGYASASYILISTVGVTWGDGAAANLLDGKPGTKWGGNFTSGNIVWRLKNAIQPLYYQLTAGGDTGNNPGRNWKSWAIYAANFDKAISAKADAEGWVEIYSTEDGGMTTESGKTQDFDFTTTPTESYQYFKVVLKSVASGNLQQMADLNIIDGTTFQNNKNAALQALQDFQTKYDYSEATDEQKNTFSAAVDAVIASTYKNLDTNVAAAWAAEKAMADYLASDDKFGAESVSISSGLDADVFTRNIPAVGDVDIIEGFDNNQTGFYTKTVTKTSDGTTTTTNYGVPDDGILKTSSGHTYAFDYDNLNAVSIKKGETKTMTLDGERQSKSWRFYFLGTASNGPADMTATFNYQDGTTSTAEFQIYNWDTNNDVTRAVTVYQTGRVYNGNLNDGNNNFRFFEIPAFVDQNKVIKSISLYNSGETKANSKAMVFGFCIVGKDDSAEMFYMGSNGYATYVPEIKDIDVSGFNAEDLAAYTVSFDPKGWANLTQVTKIPAGSAVVMKGKAGSYKLPYTTGAAALNDNELKAATTDVTADGTQFVLANGSKGVGFYKAEANSIIAAGKGYLEISGEAGVKGFYGFEFNDATGIEETLSNSPLKGENIFNLAGQRMSKMQKGINIVGGKKVLK
jgi:hypothetical protein